MMWGSPPRAAAARSWEATGPEPKPSSGSVAVLGEEFDGKVEAAVEAGHGGVGLAAEGDEEIHHGVVGLAEGFRKRRAGCVDLRVGVGAVFKEDAGHLMAACAGADVEGVAPGVRRGVVAFYGAAVVRVGAHFEELREEIGAVEADGGFQGVAEFGEVVEVFEEDGDAGGARGAASAEGLCEVACIAGVPADEAEDMRGEVAVVAAGVKIGAVFNKPFDDGVAERAAGDVEWGVAVGGVAQLAEFRMGGEEGDRVGVTALAGG
jgi:hypothetical protein